MDGENEFIPLSPDRVKEIVSMNQQKKKPHTLKDFMIQETVVAEIAYENVVGQDSLSRFDDNFGKKKKNKPTRNPNQSTNPNQNKPQRVDRDQKTVAVTTENSDVEANQSTDVAQKNRNNNNKRRNNNRRNFDKNRNQNLPDSNNAKNE